MGSFEFKDKQHNPKVKALKSKHFKIALVQGTVGKVISKKFCSLDSPKALALESL